MRSSCRLLIQRNSNDLKCAQGTLSGRLKCFYCVPPRKNAFLIAFGVEIYCMEQSTIELNLASPADFAGVYDIITSLAMVREPGIEIIESTP